MALSFTGAGVASAASGASPQAVTTATALNAGDIVVALISYDNSGGSGADPMTGTIALAPATGAVGSSVSAQTGLNDPGAASVGLAVRCVAFPVTTTIPSGTVVNVSWTGTIVVRAVALMKVTSAQVTRYVTNSGATGGNTVGAATTVALVTPSATTGDGVLCWVGYEYGAAVTGDADTTNGSWSAVYGTFTGSTTSGQSAYYQSKVVTGTGTQSFQATGTSSDWITGALIFREVPPVTATMAAALGALTSTATALVEHAATMAAPLGGLTADMAATVSGGGPATIDAVLDAPLGALTATATAVVEHPATLTAPLGALTAAATGTVDHPATLAAPLGALTGSSSAGVTHPATMAAPLGSLTGTMAAAPDRAAVLAAPLGTLTASMAATVIPPGQTVNAVLAAPLGSLTGTAAAVVEHPAVLIAALGTLTATMTATATSGPDLPSGTSYEIQGRRLIRIDT